MPELPEVERTRRTIAAHVIGATLTAVRLPRRDICQSFDTGGRPRRTTDHDLLLDARIVTTLRHGKQLALVADDGRTLCIHLGMSGQLIYRPDGQAFPKQNHIHASWAVNLAGPSPAEERSGTLVFRDPRRFGGLWTFPTSESLREHRWKSLGPDALKITAARLAQAAGTSRRAIKAVLLDQAAIAGVGNIYADEALFAARIHPATRADRLSAAQITLLAASIRTILSRAVRAGGSTLRDYVDSDGNAGTAQSLHLVYGHAGAPCTHCGTPLKASVLAQRTTVHCPKCQPKCQPSRPPKRGKDLLI